MLELLRRGLTEEGHNVMCASDGSEGWELAHAYEFDAVVLDVMLPKMNGFELAKKASQGTNRHTGADAHRQGFRPGHSARPRRRRR